MKCRVSSSYHRLMAQTVNVLGVSHAYELTPPRQAPCVLVFVHGWLLSREYWKPLISRLSIDYQCLSYDLRGFGESCAESGTLPQTPAKLSAATSSTPAAVRAIAPQDRGDSQAIYPTQSTPPSTQPLNPTQPGATSEAIASSHTPSAYAQDLIAMLAALNIESAWVIGHSLGGSIALWASHLAPNLIQGVICVNSGGGIYVKEEFEKFRAAGRQLVRFRTPWISRFPFFDRVLSRMNVAQPIDLKWGKQRLHDLIIAEADAAIGTLLDSTTEEEVHSLPQLVAKLKQPVYFISGLDDDIMEPKYVNHLASFHPSFQCVGKNVTQICNCGHMAMIEQTEQVEAHIRQYLSAHGFGLTQALE